MARRSTYQIRSPPKEVFPESTLSPGGLQLTTLFWDTGILFHQGSHAGARVGNNFEVFGCITTHVSAKCNAPPHPSFWRRIPSPGSSFSLTSPITPFTSTAYQGGVHRRHHPFPRNHSPHPQLPPHTTTGAPHEQFSQQGRATTHLPIKHDDDQRASSDGAVHHASEAGLGPVQNGTAPGSPIDKEAGYCRGTGYPNVSMGNSAPQGHNRNPLFQNATGHDRTGVGGVRNGNIDMNNRHAPPAGHPIVQPT
ncbi:hypothetical protein EDB85DRAFT_1885813 [Lactarius pseudohatsudake]|nr:hypothetical protein EDB85DRAFT_1885813 [Lactarius pseudohatsudake]